jgi:hypothetical protein
MERAREEVGEYAAEGTAPAAMERPTVDEPCADDGDDAGPRVSLRIGGEVVTIGVPSTYPQVGRLPRALRSDARPPYPRQPAAPVVSAPAVVRTGGHGAPVPAQTGAPSHSDAQGWACHTGRVPPI